MIAVAFAIVIALFFVYDMFVQRRNEKLIANAARTNALVSSLFPGALRDKVIEQENATSRGHSGHGNLRAFMSDGKQLPETKGFATAPMADLFLETTIMFADIVGFTAWSSTREPAHVFTLLETMYSSFGESFSIPQREVEVIFLVILTLRSFFSQMRLPKQDVCLRLKLLEVSSMNR